MTLRGRPLSSGPLSAEQLRILSCDAFHWMNDTALPPYPVYRDIAACLVSPLYASVSLDPSPIQCSIVMMRPRRSPGCSGGQPQAGYGFGRADTPRSRCPSSTLLLLGETMAVHKHPFAQGDGSQYR